MWIQQVEDGYTDAQRELAAIAEARDENTELIVAAGLEGGHRLLAKVFRAMFPNMLVYLGKTDGWFVFRSPKWQSIGMDVECVMALVDEQLHETVAEALQKFLEEEVTNDDAIKGFEGLLKSIAKLPFKKQLVEQLAISYRAENPKEWLNQLDGNEYLLGFEDCVYDFYERCFREGRPEDMISMSTGHKQPDIETHMVGSKRNMRRYHVRRREHARV
jgi:hypothetical protein